MIQILGHPATLFTIGLIAMLLLVKLWRVDFGDQDRFAGWSDGEVLAELEAQGEGLTEWEITFVEDLTRRVDRGEQLTRAQREKLRQIAEERVR